MITPLLLIVVELMFVAFTARLRVESLVSVPLLLMVVELTFVIFPARALSESARSVC